VVQFLNISTLLSISMSGEPTYEVVHIHTRFFHLTSIIPPLATLATHNAIAIQSAWVSWNVYGCWQAKQIIFFWWCNRSN